MFKLLYNCTYFTCEQGNTQNPSSQASAEHELRTFRCTKWIQKMQSSQRLNCQHLLNNRKSKEIPKQIYFCFTDCTKAFDCVDHNKLENSSRYGNTRLPYLPPAKPVCRSRSNSQNQTWNNGLVQNCERSTSRLNNVILLI